MLARIMLQDMAGFPALNDFAAMRAEAQRQNFDPTKIEPLVPVDLVVDHSVVVDVSNSADALRKNMEIEFERNGERYTFLKWAKAAFSGIRVVPPGNGICHQVNLEYLSRGVWEKDGIYYPDSTVGTDSHTTMVNAIGVLAWGVGGIEAEAGMLGQPYYFLEPDVVGVHMSGKLNPGVTATDLVLTVTELLRKTNVVNKFVEYFGEGAASLTPTDRATVANMAPDYGATCGFFAIDDKTLDYYRMSGREEHVDAIESYLKAQGMYGIPKKGEIDYYAGRRARSLDRAPQRIRSEAARGTHQPRRHQGALHRIVLEAGRRERLQQAGRRPRKAFPRREYSHRRRRPWRHRHCRDHLLHQHVEPVGAAGRGSARQEGGRTRHETASAREDLDGAGLQGRHRLPQGFGPVALPRATGLLRRRLRLHHLHGSGRSARQGPRRFDRQERRHLCGRPVRQPQLRSARAPEPQGQLPDEPAAGGRLRARRHGAEERRHRPARQRQERQTGVPERPLAHARRSRCS